MQAPNLFDFATSELSQDAFICWLASWADPALTPPNADLKVQYEALHATATAFLDQLLEVGKGPKVFNYRTIQVKRQENDIDVVLIVNGDTAIIIEDKIDSKDHSGQLERYKKAVARKFPKDRIAAVYLKTIDQCDYTNVDQAGYGRFLRRDFLAILDRGVGNGVKNDIFADFHRRLRRIEEAVKSYQDVPLAEWGQDPNRWRGFFIALQQRLGDGEWDQMGHPGARSLAFRWHWRPQGQTPLADRKFLRLMNKELCFRIEVPDESQRVAKWNEWRQALMTHTGTTGITLNTAPRREGRRMAVAVLDGDYRQANDEGLLDFERTVQKIKQAELLMDTAVGEILSSRFYGAGGAISEKIP